MSNNNTHSVLFELQKNLEELSSAKEQVDFFRDKSLEITDGISEVHRKYVVHLESIKTDYQNRVNDLKIELSSFLSKTEEENFKAIQKVVDKSEETIGEGIEKFEAVAQKVESSNNEKIKEIKILLENYKSVVEASNSLIEILTAIDFPTKLDALSSKSQLIIECITSAKQALEIKLNESQSLVIEKINTAKEQLIQNTEQKNNALSEKITDTNDIVKTIISNNFEAQSRHTTEVFQNLDSLIGKHINNSAQRLDNQDKEIATLKKLLFVTVAATIASIILSIIIIKYK